MAAFSHRAADLKGSASAWDRLRVRQVRRSDRAHVVETSLAQGHPSNTYDDPSCCDSSSDAATPRFRLRFHPINLALPHDMTFGGADWATLPSPGYAGSDLSRRCRFVRIGRSSWRIFSKCGSGRATVSLDTAALSHLAWAGDTWLLDAAQLGLNTVLTNVSVHSRNTRAMGTLPQCRHRLGVVRNGVSRALGFCIDRAATRHTC